MSDETHDPMNRRRALKVLGALPLAAAVADAQQAPTTQPPRQGHADPNQPTRDTRQPRNQPARRFFTQKEMRTVRRLADDIIPRDARSGSATDAGMPEFIDFNLSVPETDDATRTAWRGGLRWLDTESRKRFDVAYASATEAQRHAILDDIAGPVGPALGQPATPATAIPAALRYGATFFARARDMVASGFFSSAIGYKDLQYIGNAFNPNWNGCPPAALQKLGVSYDMMNGFAKPAE